MHMRRSHRTLELLKLADQMIFKLLVQSIGSLS